MFFMARLIGLWISKMGRKREKLPNWRKNFLFDSDTSFELWLVPISYQAILDTYLGILIILHGNS